MQYHKQQPVPLVLGSYLNAYGIIRSLGQKGVRSQVADCTYRMAVYSRYVSRKYLIPDPISEPDASAASIAEIGRTRGPVLIYPSNGVWADLIMSHYHTIGASCIIPFPDPDILRLCNDRVYLNDLAAHSGLPVPRTVHWGATSPMERIIDKVVRDFCFPVFVKPLDKGLAVKFIRTYSRTFTKAHDLEKWADQVSKKAYEYQVAMTFQEQVGGMNPENVAVQGYRSRHDGRLSATTYRKIRQHPPQNGSALCAVIDCNERLVSAAENILPRIGYYGLFDLEFIRDRQTNDIYCIDMNPRSGMLIYGSTVAGMNLPWIQYADYTGFRIHKHDWTYNGPVIWWRILGDVIYTALRSNTWTCEGVLQYASSLRYRKAMADLDFSDPSPGFYEIARLPKRLSSRNRRTDEQSIEIVNI